MRLLVKNKTFVAVCSFQEREIPKKAGFRWNPDTKVWYTHEPRTALRLRNYADESAKRELSQYSLAVTPWTGAIPLYENESLYPFQLEAVRFALSRNNSYLALDPGLGKTICAAVVIRTLKKATTYICPPFLKENVTEELTKWKAIDYVDIRTDTKLEEPSSSEVIVVDEAHRFKNANSKRSENLFRKHTAFARKRIFLSGSFLPNRPMELYTILSNSAPETIDFANYFEYGRRYCGGHKGPFGWDFSGHSNLPELKTRLLPFLHRVTSDVANLPGHTEDIILLEDNRSPTFIEMDEGLLKKHSPKDLMKHQIGDVHIATYRRQLGMYKVESAMSYIKMILEAGEESILIFAIHKEVILKLRRGLADYDPLFIDGSVETYIRHEVAKEYMETHKRVLIGNIQAMGIGFNLQKATRVIFVEFSWTDADNDQALRRADRIGQKSKVAAEYLVYRNSLDKQVLEACLEKRKILKAFD